MKFDKKSRSILIIGVLVIIILAQFLPTVSRSYTNSDSPAHFANALLVTLDKEVSYPIDIFHYRFYEKFRVSGIASVSVDAHLPLPPMYLFYLYPIFKILDPLNALAIMYFSMALFSGLNALIIYLWVKREMDDHSAAIISAFIFGIMPIGYMFFAGGDFPQIMGQLFVLISIFSVSTLYKKIMNIKIFILLTAIITVSLLVHLGSTVGLLSILFVLFVYHLYKIKMESKKESSEDQKGFFKILFKEIHGRRVILFGASVLLAFIISYFSYYHYFIDLFISASTKSSTGSFLIPQIDSLYQLIRSYWIFVIFIPLSWKLIDKNKDFRAYIYSWFLVSLIYFVINVEIRYVYLIYQPIAISSGIFLNKYLEDSKYRKYVIYFIIIIFIATLIYSSTWWTYFAKTNYSDKIINVMTNIR
ncbi:hypothetical protein J4216_06865 [Candidatus Woesearchaeota archaeon]|nr:hypothetical protein [Candidatus Woesearchaeota archaeon]